MYSFLELGGVPLAHERVLFLLSRGLSDVAVAVDRNMKEASGDVDRFDMPVPFSCDSKKNLEAGHSAYLPPR